jgi:DNA polymerase III delta' subunit
MAGGSQVKQMQWQGLVGQDRVKQVLGSAFANDSMGHAYLFCGDEGAGTFAAAVILGSAALCESSGDSPETAVPCGHCSACHRIQRYSHPDFHLVFPVSLQKEEKASDGGLKQKGWENLAARAQERIAAPYLPLEDNALPTIPVDWIRELNEAIQRGSGGSGMNVAIMAGIDHMSKESANALLKTLEEPPPRTLMILCTERPHDVLPTIVSRCQIIRFGAIAPEKMAAYLAEHYADRASQATIDDAVLASQGSLGKAISLVLEPQSRARELAGMLLGLARTADPLAVCRGVESIAAAGDPELLEKAFAHCVYLIRSAVMAGVAPSRTYFADRSVAEQPVLPAVDLRTGQRMVAVCEAGMRAVRSRGQPLLTVSTMVFELAEILNGK